MKPASGFSIVAPLRWIGDAPIIEMTDFTILTVITFSVRLLFYGDRYAGTWHGKFGGQYAWDDPEGIQELRTCIDADEGRDPSRRLFSPSLKSRLTSTSRRPATLAFIPSEPLGR